MTDHCNGPLAERPRMATILEDDLSRVVVTKSGDDDMPDSAAAAAVVVDDMDCIVENGNMLKVVDNTNVPPYTHEQDRPVYQR